MHYIALIYCDLLVLPDIFQRHFNELTDIESILNPVNNELFNNIHPDSGIVKLSIKHIKY